MTAAGPAPPELRIVQIRRPDHDLLVMLESLDREAFGSTGLRTYDLAVMAQAGGVYVAYAGEQIVGSFQLMRTLDEPDFFYIVGFYVLPGRQGRGLGRALLLGLAEEVKKLGGKGLLLTVAPGNERAIRLYRSTGFVDETFVPDFYGDGQDRHIQRWRFDQEGLPGGV